VKKLNLLITGMGGQGVILASDILGEVALAAGYDVKKTDTLGMAQRGGSVVSHVRIAHQVWSPLRCASTFLPLKIHTWKDGISQRLPSKIQRINIIAFNQGRKEIQGVHL